MRNERGSVYKMKGKNRRKPFRVLAPREMVYDPIKKDYKQIQKTIAYTKTKLEGYQILAKHLQEPDKFNQNNLTFAEFYDIYAEKKFINAKPAVIQYHKYAYKFSTPIHNMLLSEINENILQDLISKSNLSTGYLNKVKLMWNQMYNFAIFKKIVDTNYTKEVKIPDKETNYTKTLFNETDIDLLWKNHNEFINKLLLIYIYTGLRRAELFNIKKENVHIEEKYIIGGFKTRAGTNRVIPIHHKILPFIEEFMKLSNTGYLVPNQIDGYKYTDKTIDFHVKKYAKNCRTRHNVHDCRHTCVSRLYRYDADPVSIAKIIGHSRGNITEDLYTTKSVEELLKAIEVLP